MTLQMILITTVKYKMKESNVGDNVGVNRGTVIGVEQKGCVVEKAGLRMNVMGPLVVTIGMSAVKIQLWTFQVHNVILCFFNKA
jgi:hypothetical protein